MLMRLQFLVREDDLATSPNDYAMGQAHSPAADQHLRRDAVSSKATASSPAWTATRPRGRRRPRSTSWPAGPRGGSRPLRHDCYRCHPKLEPWESEQWFVAVDGSRRTRPRGEDGSIQFHPARWKQVYLDWLENLKDWCISRQLWWGHRIPVFYCDDCGWEDALGGGHRARPVCGQPVRQDENVLDTWFSSQLWPFATRAGRKSRRCARAISDYGALHRTRHHRA